MPHLLSKVVGWGIFTLVAFAMVMAGCSEPQSPVDYGSGFVEIEVDEEESQLVVEESETVVVVAEVERTDRERSGPPDDLQVYRRVRFEIEDVAEDSVEVELAYGESEEVTLQWQTEESDAGDYEADVTSSDEWKNVSVTVEQAD